MIIILVVIIFVIVLWGAFVFESKNVDKKIENKMALELSTFKQKNLIYSLTSIFENSSTELNYIYAENIGDWRWITFGFPGFTSGTFDWTEFLKEFSRLSPGNVLEKYIPAFEKIDSLDHAQNWLNDDTTWLDDFIKDIATLKDDELFKRAQHNIVDKMYYEPAMKVSEDLWLTFLISKWEMYDSFINHWSEWAMEIITKTSNELWWNPRTWVLETEWLKHYLKNRYEVLAADKTWAEAVDRVKVYEKLLKDENYFLDELPLVIECYWEKFEIK